MCRLTAMLASVMLLLASFVGPLFHLHEASHHDHDAIGRHTHSAVIHTHLTFHSSSLGKEGRPIFVAADEGNPGSQVSLCVFEQKAPALMPFLPGRGFVTEPIRVSSVFSPAPAPQAHDPPTTDFTDARAPPA